MDCGLTAGRALGVQRMDKRIGSMLEALPTTRFGREATISDNKPSRTAKHICQGETTDAR
jgi:hypothetical protein